ncbi:MAG: twin-arginine translocase TatA/TatE family subunit [Anaerolineales bacterium]|nr:twin-arginine translocase TatA/TatE family subunit [Anaerolineales bacterium]
MLFKHLGPTELLIILAIVVLVFGVGRLGKLGKDLGTGIREFRKGIKNDETEGAQEPEDVEKEADKDAS